MKEISPYLSFGIPNTVANKLDKAALTKQAIKKISQEDLKKKAKISIEEAEAVKAFIIRKPVPRSILSKLLENSNFTCCICKGKKADSYLVHHIKEYSDSKDNAYSNLAILCPNDHDLAHKKGITLTRKLTAKQIIDAKSKWEKLVNSHNGKKARMPKSKEQWNYIAEKTANYVFNHLFPVHRGAFLFDKNTSVVFGNDGYKSKNTKSEINLFREILQREKIEELGFGVSDGKYSWCFIVRSKKVDYLNNAIWTCYPAGGSNNMSQKIEALKNLYSYKRTQSSLFLLS
jgi:5-methylcytosine-specific restriction endonuclease McrA